MKQLTTTYLGRLTAIGLALISNLPAKEVVFQHQFGPTGISGNESDRAIDKTTAFYATFVGESRGSPDWSSAMVPPLTLGRRHHLDDLGSILCNEKKDIDVRITAAGALTQLGEPAWKYSLQSSAWWPRTNPMIALVMLTFKEAVAAGKR